MTRTRYWPIVVVGAVVVAACSGSDEAALPTADSGSVVEAASTSTEAVAPPTTDAPTTSVAPPTSSTSTSTTTAPPTTTTTIAEPAPTIDDVRINELQVIGSHNSYHLAPEGAVKDGLFALVPAFAVNLDYTHRTLTEQLDRFGIRQFEIDVFADPEGGHYSNRQGPPVVGEPAESGIAELDEPGFKVLHIQDFDFRTTCFTLVACLTELEAWSSANPTHVPIHVMIEIKEDTIEQIAEDGEFELPDLDVEWTVPIPTTAELLTDLE
ncbi:MAG: hypothetical protein HKN41_08110, partial [Ilumatobacter sp.]|nr:hypothetical protein [Ilumatobacter sp.]